MNRTASVVVILESSVGRAARTEGRLAAVAAERAGQIGALAALQQDDDDQQQAYDYMKKK